MHVYSTEDTAPAPTLCCARLNAASKTSGEVKVSGYRKDSSANSSCRLFCTGVPVSSSTCEGEG